MTGIASIDLHEPEEDTRQDAHDDIERRANDETWWQVNSRERAEDADARMRRDLADSKRSRAVYRDIADAQTDLSHAQFRVLSYLLRKASPDLSNAFPSQKSAALALGMRQPTYNAHLVALRDAGWVRTHEFHAEGRQSSSGIQFCIPAGVLPLREPWNDGPVRFDNRISGAPKQERRPRQRVKA